MADRSIIGWDTVTKYEIDPIASTSGGEKKIRAAENIALSQQKNKKLNKPTVGVSIHRTSGYQFWINSLDNGFTPSNQRTSNIIFPSNKFTKNNFF